jgi:hypothetical protein
VKSGVKKLSFREKVTEKGMIEMIPSRSILSAIWTLTTVKSTFSAKIPYYLQIPRLPSVAQLQFSI